MFLRQSTLTFGDAKIRVCESAGTTTDPESLLRAGRAIQSAMRIWNNRANWKWLRLTTEEIPVTAQEDTYTIPVLCKAVHTVRMTGDFPRTLQFIGRRQLNRMNQRQDMAYRPWAYDLFRSTSDNGKIRLIDIPSVNESMVIDYYRQMVIPCYVTLTSTHSYDADSTIFPVPSSSGMTVGSPLISTGATVNLFATPTTITSIVSKIQLIVADAIPESIGQDEHVQTIVVGGDTELIDIPADYEDGIVALGTYIYLINRGSGGPRLQYWQAESERRLQEAIAANFEDTPDEELAILPPYMFDNTIPLGPNDIRWANLGW